MSNCKVYFDKSGSNNMRVSNCSKQNDVCVCPREGEPCLLTIVAPAVFDECGINLCRVISLPETCCGTNGGAVGAIVEVIDIDFNIGDHGSSVCYIKNKPNCCKVKLSNIEVTCVIRLLDDDGDIIHTTTQTILYLPPECHESYDPETNPSSIGVELFAPYGLSYSSCNTYVPIINYIGNIESNNYVPQGVDVQAIAKVLRVNQDNGYAALGLTLYIKTVYQVQYKIPHAGLAIPPKCIPIEEAVDTCMEFVEGDLLERSIAPLEVARRPRSFNNNSDNDCNNCHNDDFDDDNCYGQTQYCE